MAHDNDNAMLSDDILAGVAGGVGESPQQGSVTFTCPCCRLKASATADEVNSFAVVTCGFCHKQIKLLGFGRLGEVLCVRAECWEG